ncbi:hypothetical protein DFH09DRAFT_1305869 [Mycena vulgaris]|nr:hypothetical protein DFH09DRAFT_1305869 [Mycena vulgaris]
MLSLVLLLFCGSLGNAAVIGRDHGHASCPSANTIAAPLVDGVLNGGLILCTYSSELSPCTYLSDDGSFQAGSSNCPSSIADITIMDFLCPALNLNHSVDGDGAQLERATNVSEILLQCEYFDGAVCSYSRGDGNIQSSTGGCPSSIDPAHNIESEFDCEELDLQQSFLIGTSTHGTLAFGFGLCPPTVTSSTICPPSPITCLPTNNNNVKLAIGLPSISDPAIFECIYLDGERCTYGFADGRFNSGSSVCPQSIAHGSTSSSKPTSAFGPDSTSAGFNSSGIAAAGVQGGSSRLADNEGSDATTAKNSAAPSPTVIALLSVNGVLVLFVLVVAGVWLAGRRSRSTKRVRALNPESRYETIESTSVPLTQYSDKWISSDKSTNSSTAVDSIQTDVPRWSPKILRLLPTGIFGAFLLLLIIGLELFNRHSPYNAPSSGLQFLWTYAPVGLLMVVQWIWTAYDLQVKILVPWAALSRGPTPAEQGWLLDYIGVNALVGMLIAFKYRHVVVLLTTLGLWTMAIAGIVATSLFKIEDIAHTSTANFKLTTSLDRSLLTNFDPAILADKNYLNSYLGRQLLGLSRPHWTTSDDIVLEAFEDSSGSVPDRFLAQTHGYSGSLKCTPAVASYGGNVSIPPNPIPDAVALFVDVEAAGCKVKYPLADTNHLALCYKGDDPTCYLGRLYNHTCPGSSVYTTALVLVYTNSFGFVSTSAVEYAPSYSQYLLDVSSFPSSSGPVNASIVTQSTDSPMNNGWGGMLQWLNATEGRQRNFSASVTGQRDPFGLWGDVPGTGRCDCDPWLNLLTHAQNASLSALMDTAALLNATAQSFPGIFSDVAQTLLMTTPPSASTPLSGAVQNITRQLVARQTSVRIAQVTLSVLLAIVLAVYLLRPQPDLPMDPSSMADTITVTNAETRTLLNDWSFSIQNQKEFRIATQRRGKSSTAAPKFVKAPVWRPTILHPVFKLFMWLVVLGTIIARDGPSEEPESWTYIAPAYLFILGIFLSSYTFSVSTLEPFFAMHRSPQPARKSVRYSPATQTHAGLVLLHAFRYRSLVGLSCAMIMLTIPFLKIVVSGLISTASEPAEGFALLAATTTFNTTTPLAQNTRPEDIPKLILALSQIQKYQLPLPAWTTPEASVAQVDTARLGQVVQAPNTTIQMPLEVARAKLGSCSMLHPVNPGTSLALPSECPTGENASVLLSLPTSPGWFGKLHAVIQDITVLQCLSYTLSIATQNVVLAYERNTATILAIDTAASNPTTTNISFPTDPEPFEVLLGNIPATSFESDASLSFDTLFQVMTLKDPSTPLATFLDPAQLTTAAQAVFATYGAVYASLRQRVPIPEARQSAKTVVVNYRQTRIVQAKVPTRILQALLACVLFFGLITALAVRKTNNVLTKRPYSIGATMGLLADSAFVELQELRDVKDEAELERLLEPYEFQLGWGNNPSGGLRFGVDIVAE